MPRSAMPGTLPHVPHNGPVVRTAAKMKRTPQYISLIFMAVGVFMVNA
jgi:hypothetical protein